MARVVAISTRRAEPAGDQRTSKADLVYRELREAILSGELAPGQCIDKLALCGKLGVSRFPVATAINRLAFERLVVVEPQHGSFVARMSIEQVEELLLLRRSLESELAMVAAERLGAQAREALQRNLRYQAAAAAAGDLRGFQQLDGEFHDVIVRGVGFPHARDILESLKLHVGRVRRMLLQPEGRLEVALDEHRAIAAAIEARDAKGAGRAMRAHLANTTQVFAEFAAAHSDLFSA
ncbi:MAG: GntR family transcriptional regulator [Hyphomicrobiales bacterium]|nr:GntR family transcriptional regulator [Hyphomicrobiales bacterium]MDE2017532.1 GntR family transcriptional regulator [Hyphomicrobiales bacterium]